MRAPQASTVTKVTRPTKATPKISQWTEVIFIPDAPDRVQGSGCESKGEPAFGDVTASWLSRESVLAMVNYLKAPEGLDRIWERLAL